MARFLRFLALGLAALLVMGGAAVFAALQSSRDIPAEVLEARYMAPSSRFIVLDGVRMHYRDEGRPDGPAVLLLHANFGNLLGWDPWVEVLADAFRVIRVDMTAHGLTGPDPTGDYSLERTVDLTAWLVDALGLDRFTIAGTSLGGTVAIHYTARYPERIDRVILLSPGSLYGREMDAAGRGVPDAADILTRYMPRALPAYMLRSRFGDPERVSEALIDQWYEMWMREGQRAAMLARLRSYSSADTIAAIESIEVPVLILWGEANPQAPIEQAAELAGLLVNASERRVLTYPGVGHMAIEEAGELIGRDVRAWLDGSLDTPEEAAGAG
ncbi:MAG: alpha/beta hydrolase [Chromatiales bacterium]|nr:alpha/beta hydrolase [Chromatiales bacterium]